MEKEKTKNTIFKIAVVLFLFFILYSSFFILAFADTIYFKDGTMQKGLVVEEYYDRFVFNTEEGEQGIPKSNIDEIFFDEQYQNNLYLGKRFEAEGNFEKALYFYQLALQSNSDFKDARDAIKGLEDAKWRFEKEWSYLQLREMVKNQLGVGLKSVNGKIVVSKGTDDPIEMVPDTIKKGDGVVSCWAKPLAYAGLKNASRILIGFPNSLLELVIERDIPIGPASSLMGLFSPINIEMEIDGPRVKSIKGGSAFSSAGLKEGDMIVRIDGESTRYMKLSEVNKRMLNSPKGRLVAVRRKVTLMRKRSVASNAMWVWHSKEILLDEKEKKELFEFCKEKNIGTLFFQLQYEFIPGGQFSSRLQSEARELSPAIICRLLYETRLRAFLKDAHSVGLKAHSLDGSPAFCLESGHRLALAQLKALLDFNAKNPPEERFDGLHYDNEPYLLPGFHSTLKETIINQFVALNKKLKDQISLSGARFEFGIDIPFWFDITDSLYKRLLDICDNVGIMDYRNFASGPDGIIAHATDELRYAGSKGKKVFIGVETSRPPDQKVYFGSIVDEVRLGELLLKDGYASFFEGKEVDGFSIRAHPYGKKVYLGLVRPDGADEEIFKKAILKMAGLFGAIQAPEGKADLEAITFDAINELSKNPELKNIEYDEYRDGQDNPCLVFKADEVMLEKLTFFNLREKDLNNALNEARGAFIRYPAFAGFAIHHYKSYKELGKKK